MNNHGEITENNCPDVTLSLFLASQIINQMKNK